MATLRAADERGRLQELFSREPRHWSEQAIKDEISRLEACWTKKIRHLRVLKCQHLLNDAALRPSARKSPCATERLVFPCQRDAKGCAAMLAR